MLAFTTAALGFSAPSPRGVTGRLDERQMNASGLCDLSPLRRGGSSGSVVPAGNFLSLRSDSFQTASKFQA